MRIALLNPDRSFKGWREVDDDSVLDTEFTRPCTLTPRPIFDSATHKVVEDAPTITDTEAIVNWSVVPLTVDELQQLNDVADLEQVKGVLLDLKHGVGTSGERLLRLERVVFRLAKLVLT